MSPRFDLPFNRIESSTGKEQFHCSSCGYVYRDAFFESSILKKIRQCKKCQIKTTTEARIKNRNNPYRRMLKHVKQKSTTSNENPYSLKEKDIQYLYDEVWKKKCALSGKTGDLSFVTWKKEIGLKPWNLVLMKNKYSQIHRKNHCIFHISYQPETTIKIEGILANVEQHYQK